MLRKLILSLILLTSTLSGTLPTFALPVAQAPAPSTITPSPTSSNLLLTKKDLPTGFEELPENITSDLREQGTNLLQQLSQVKLNPKNLFAFVNADTLEMVSGFSDQLPDQASQNKFDATLNQIQQPETQKKLISSAEDLLSTLGDVEILEHKTFPTPNNLGNKSTGLTISMNVAGQPARLDLISFRQNNIAALTLVLYLNTNKSSIKVDDIARLVNTRISQPSNLPQ